jgi:hypothetical protein
LMLYSSGAFDRLLIEDGSQQKLEALKAKGTTPLEVLLNACAPIGVLRLYSVMHDQNLKFKGMRYRFFGRSLEYNIDDLVKEVSDNTSKGTDKAAASNFIKEFDRSAIDVRQLVCGHDLSACLSVALRSMFGTRSSAQCATVELETKLRLGFSLEMFSTTGVFSDLQEWEKRNAPFRCLH